MVTSEMERLRSRVMASCVGEEKPPVKPNWMGPSATMSVQSKAETWDLRMAYHQLPVFTSSGFRMSMSSWSLPPSPPMTFNEAVAKGRDRGRVRGKKTMSTLNCLQDEDPEDYQQAAAAVNVEFLRCLSEVSIKLG